MDTPELTKKSSSVYVITVTTTEGTYPIVCKSLRRARGRLVKLMHEYCRESCIAVPRKWHTDDSLREAMRSEKRVSVVFYADDEEEYKLEIKKCRVHR